MEKELESSHVESSNGDAGLSKGDIDNSKLEMSRTVMWYVSGRLSFPNPSLDIRKEWFLPVLLSKLKLALGLCHILSSGSPC